MTFLYYCLLYIGLWKTETDDSTINISPRRTLRTADSTQDAEAAKIADVLDYLGESLVELKQMFDAKATKDKEFITTEQGIGMFNTLLSLIL